ncbi:MAG: hypothetical protein QOG79_1511 [Mycobacterium sp.]|jgi:hypothetical protein|nr:hypothetical protein [Mycobacterium sp.]
MEQDNPHPAAVTELKTAKLCSNGNIGTFSAQ